MESKYLILLLVSCCVSEVKSAVLEDPEDVTAVEGDPATLVCRVDTDNVKWYKDGVEMKNEDDEEIFQLPDGSLFFLSSRQHDTALYNCASVGVDGEILMSKPAALIVYGGKHAEDIHVEETINMANNQEEESVYNFEYKDKHTKVSKPETTTTNTIHVEVIEEEIPASVYIIIMILVGAMTVLIIAGAAIIFTKIKYMQSEHHPEAGDLYSGTLHQYQKPINVLTLSWPAFQDYVKGQGGADSAPPNENQLWSV